MKYLHTVILFVVLYSTIPLNAADDLQKSNYPQQWHAEEQVLRLEVGGEDWRNFKTFSLPISSTKQTGARIAIDILGENDQVLGRTVFAADWVGDNTMHLWLANFEPKEGSSRYREVEAVRLQCEEEGLWPTILQVDHYRLSKDEPVWPVNSSDVVVDMGWHEVMARPEVWSMVEEDSSIEVDELLVTKPWPWTEFSYIQKKRPGQLTMIRNFDIDLGPYSQMLGKMMWDKDSVLSATAIVDGGKEIQLFEGAWKDGWYTFGNDLGGAEHLEAVRLKLKEKPTSEYTGRKVTMGLFYLLLRKPTALDDAPMVEVQVRKGPADQIWPGSYTNHFPEQEYVKRRVPKYPFEDSRFHSDTRIGDPMMDSLPIGLMVRRENLGELRRQALDRETDAGRIFANIKRQADLAIATEMVDRKVGTRLYGGGLGQPKGLMGAGMRVYAPQVAVTHLITGEEKYAIAARRWILRAAVSDQWRAEGTGSVNRPQIGDLLPYSDSFTDWHPKGFAGYMNIPYHVGDTGFGAAVAFDMLYHCFNAEERRLVEEAFADKGVYILYDKLRHYRDFYVKFNQGAWFATPLFMQAAFLRDNDPVYEDMYNWTLKFLKDFGQDGPYSEDGVLREGAGYGDYALLLYIDALKAMSAAEDVPVTDMITPAFMNAMEYFQHTRSTSHKKPLTLAWSDNGGKNWVQGVVLACYARYLKDPAAQYLWNESYSDAYCEDVQTMILLADSNPVEAQEPNLPPAKVFWDEPLVFFRDGWKYGDTLLAMANIRHMVGHGHKDRASIILEYNGEELILDPGMVNYFNPLARQYQETFCHNTLTFSQQSQSGNEAVLSGGDKVYDTSNRGFISTSGAVCPGRKGGIDWVITDATAVYPQAEKFQRHILFLRPGVFVLYDDIEAKKPERMEINFTCNGPLCAEGNTFTSSTAKNKLFIHSVANRPLKYDFVKWGTSKPDVPSYRLIRSTAEREKSCGFLTTILPTAVSEKKPRITKTEMNESIIIRVFTDDIEYIIAHQPGERLAESGIQTDAKLAVFTREHGRLVGGAMLMGSKLIVEGTKLHICANPKSLTGAILVEDKWIMEEGQINYDPVIR